jgi:AcrR family transcriptional regulator
MNSPQIQSQDPAELGSREPLRPQRADAQRNREKILAASRELFSTAGADVSLEAIARAAGVGIGTLYRHFPSRDALVEAVYRNEVDQLCAAAAELLEQYPPEQALAEWMERFIAYAATKRGLAGALKSLSVAQSELFPATRERLLSTIASFLAAGRAAGTIRTDIDEGDVLRAMNAVWAMPDGEQWIGQARRVLRLLIDGLRRTG